MLPGRDVPPAREWLASRGSPDEAKGRPVVVEGGYLDVNQAQFQGVPAHDAVGYVAGVACGTAGPGRPDRAVRADALGKPRQPGSDLGRGAEEGEDQVGATVRVGWQQAAGRFLECPRGRRLGQGDPKARLQAQLAGLRRAGHDGPSGDAGVVAGSRHLADLVAHLGILERVDKGDVPADWAPLQAPESEAE